MLLKFCELRRREVINLNDGCRMGYVGDLEMTVPEGCIFVMGDNRNGSTDSRYAGIGPVDTRNLIGKVLTVTIPGSQTNEYGEIVAPRKWKRIGVVR